MKRALLLSVILSCLHLAASAQYFVSDPDPTFLKWKQIKRDSLGTVIYPGFIEDKGYIVGNITETIRPYITYGIFDKVDKFPITLHPTNILSNGMVTWTPSRMELITAPDNSAFAVPWLKQLTIHEFRHVAQLSNLNQGFTKGAYYVLGEQAPGLVAIIMPSYFYEGDAVAAETEMTMYGRGLQPDFTVELRAILNEDPEKLNIGKFTLGSYVDIVPDHYKLGYQVTQSAREYYGDDYWEKILNFVGRRSYTILAYYFGSLKYTGYGGNHTVHRTLKDLREYWKPFSAVDNDFTTAPTQLKRYAKYSWPMPYSDNSVISLRESYTEPRMFVSMDLNTGDESILRNVGYVTSRPVMHNGTLLWTEYKPSLSWASKNSSVIRYSDIKNNGKRLKTSRPKTAPKIEGDIYFVTPMGDNGYAMISYDRRNEPSLVICGSDFSELKRFKIDGHYTSFNGMAWDDKTQTLAAIILDEEGMYIIRFSTKDGSFQPITQPSYITVNNLRASNGKLYYNSIQSGKDEIHTYDLTENREYRITSSKYGSINPAALNDSTVVFSSFTRQGYRIAYKETDRDSLKLVEPSKMPVNLLNYPYKSWGLPKIDTMRFSSDSNENFIPKKYSKAGHLFRIHSWLPAYFNPNDLLNETQTTITVGAFAMSQNILNTMVATAGYGYVFNEKGSHPNLITATFDYTGLPVNLSLAVRWGGGDRLNYDRENIPDHDPHAYLSASAGASLPLNFSSGNRSRVLRPSVSYIYNNALFPDYIGGTNYFTVKNGMHRIKSGIYFSNVANKAKNDLTYRSGYMIQLGYYSMPGIKELGHTATAVGRLYLPGFLRNNTFTVQAGYQKTWDATMYFPDKIMFPQGHNIVTTKELIALSASYKAPLLYPDWGFLAYNLYFKRIWVDVFGEYAHFSKIADKKISPHNNAYTYGATLYADMNLLQFTSDVTIGISVFKPSDRKGPMVQFKFGVAF